MFLSKSKIFRPVAALLIVPFILTGCITYRPKPDERSSFMQRAQTQTQGKVSVTLTVLSNKESKKTFGVPLAKKGIQPVWVEIDNNDTIPYIFIPRNMDPNYYPGDEAAFMAHYRQSKQFLRAGVIAVFFFPALLLVPINYFSVHRANKKIDGLFEKISFKKNVIMPGEKNAGFVFTSVDQGVKHVHVELLADSSSKNFDFVINVPGIKADYTTKDLADRYSDEAIVECTEKELVKTIEDLPCCVTNKKGTKNGDPINLIMIGELEDIVIILTSAGWDETSALTFSSGFSMAKAFITGDNDRYSPVSPLYYNGHAHDIAFQKNRGNIDQRLHFRLWYTPIRYQEKPVWVGAISRDIGVKFTFKTWYLTTHKIDPNLDDSRDYLLADLISVQKVSHYGLIDNFALERSTAPRKNLTNDPYYTDGKRLVVELSTEDTQPKTFGWNTLAQDNAKA